MKIADLFVLFSPKGVETVQTALNAVQGQLDKAQKTMSAVGNAATASFGVAAAAVTGLATAGLAMSVQGQVMQFQMERLSRTVGGVFGPEIQKLIGFIERLTSWIDHLSA